MRKFDVRFRMSWNGFQKKTKKNSDRNSTKLQESSVEIRSSLPVDDHDYLNSITKPQWPHSTSPHTRHLSLERKESTDGTDPSRQYNGNFLFWF
jgi:hypothetical protein